MLSWEHSATTFNPYTGNERHNTPYRQTDNIFVPIVNQILSVNNACPSLVICAVPTLFKTTPELSGPAFGVLPKTGDEELEDQDKPG